jgi:hypothetical protein
MFMKIDVDGNGELDEGEFKFAMSELGLELSDVEVGLVMRELDTDGQGTIDTAEFLDRMKEIHRCAPPLPSRARRCHRRPGAAVMADRRALPPPPQRAPQGGQGQRKPARARLGVRAQARREQVLRLAAPGDGGH